MDTKIKIAGVIVAAILCATNFVFSIPVQVDNSVTAEAMDFLENYGYVQRPNTKLGKLLSDKDVTEGIKQMQRFAGFPVTGILDDATKKLMNTTRCGMPDVGRADSAKRKRRYSVQGSRWDKEELTWRIHNYGNDNLNKDLVRATIMNSLKKWSDVTNLSFKELTTGEPDIWFKFVRGAHGDPYPFRLPYSSVLAHAFYPMDSKMPLAGDVHYNDEKKYSIATGKGVDLLWVTVHELGHSIGLDHSNVHGAIMYPYYQDNQGKDFDLTPDDVIGIQTLYGAKSKPTAKIPDKATVPTIKPQNKKCFSKVGAVFLGTDKKTYVFNDDKLFILKKELGIEKGPIAVSKMFKGVEKVDAAFKKQNDKNTIIFSGKNYYEFSGDHTYVSGPTAISKGFNGFPSDFGDIDAAFVWPGNNLLYIFKGDEYWRIYLIKGKYFVATSYPRKIDSAWKGVPNNVTAAFTWRNGVTYFFKDTQYYRLSSDIKVETGYPKDITKAWAQLANCPKVGAVVAGEKSGASRTVVEITLATVAMALASFLALV